MANRTQIHVFDPDGDSIINLKFTIAHEGSPAVPVVYVSGRWEPQGGGPALEHKRKFSDVPAAVFSGASGANPRALFRDQQKRIAAWLLQDAGVV